MLTTVKNCLYCIRLELQALQVMHRAPQEQRQELRIPDTFLPLANPAHNSASSRPSGFTIQEVCSSDSVAPTAVMTARLVQSLC